MKVRAKELGIYAGKRRRKGEEFYLQPGENPARWMEVLEEAAPEKPKRGRQAAAEGGEPPQ